MRRVALLMSFVGMVGCSSNTSEDAPATTGADSGTEADSSLVQTDAATANEGGIYVVLFTHIEDQSPTGNLGTPTSKAQYATWRTSLVDMANAAKSHQLTWVLQPDWKILEAAIAYEDATSKSTTNGKNVFQYIKEDLGVVIDPHAHESGEYNYADVAYLLGQLGAGITTVIGGHIWDPALPQFQEWDRFRSPLSGKKFPSATWQGDILIGAGTPNHVNDPLVSGIWRPLSRDEFFTDAPTGNIVAVGAWHDDVAGVNDLITLRENGTVPSTAMLTAGWNIAPDEYMGAKTVADVDSAFFVPIAALRDAKKIIVTDFTSLVAKWKSAGASAYQYKP